MDDEHEAWDDHDEDHPGGGEGGFSLRPPKRWPAVADALRRSLNAGAGRVGRLWVEEFVPEGGEEPPTLVLAAELRGAGGDERAIEEVGEDLRRRVREDVEEADLQGRDPERFRYAVFNAGDDDPFLAHLRDTEPLFGESPHRVMNLARMRELLPAPRTLPAAEPSHKDELSVGDFVGASIFVVVAAGVLAAVVAWLVSSAFWATLLCVVLGVGTLALVVFMYFLSVLPATTWRAGPLRRQPVVLGHVVQALEALWVRSHPGYADGGRFGLVIVFALDPQRRDDPAWLSWMARRMAWLRDHGAEDPDETRIAQRLEGEADDGTSRIPPSVAGNDATYWVSPLITRDQLPGDRLPFDRLLPLVLAGAPRPGDAEVKLLRLWPPQLWPLRHRPPWEDRAEAADAEGDATK